MTTPYGYLTYFQLEVAYPDDSRKLQTWNKNWVERTSKLVFWTDNLKGPDAKLMGASADWRLNSCMVRYFRGEGAARTALCQHGGGRRLFAPRKNRRGRGWPNKLIFTISYDPGNLLITFGRDREWLKDTAELLFSPWDGLTEEQAAPLLPDKPDWIQNPVLARVTRDDIATRHIEAIYPEPGVNGDNVKKLSSGCVSCTGKIIA
jgi:hypothetical protein